MFARFRRFVQRNMGKVVIGVVAVPLFFRMTRIAARYYLTYRTRRTHELVQTFKKRQLFEMMEEGFGRTLRNWYDLMKQTLKENLNTEKYAEQLKDGSGDKLENWMELKISSFANILAYIYGTSMLTVLLRIQVNVISGLLFKQLEETPENLDVLGMGEATRGELSKRHIVTEEIQQEYMMLTRYLCTKGVANLCKVMNEKCREAVGHLSLKQKLTIKDLEQLFMAVREKEVKNNEGLRDWSPVTQTWHYVFSEEMTTQFLYPTEAFSRTYWVNEREVFLRTLMGEAYDLLNSEDTRTVLKYLETQGINFYLDRISEFMSTIPIQPVYSDSVHSMDVPRSISSHSDLSEPSAAVAKLIPVMNSLANVPYSDDVWVSLLLENGPLKSFSANIYESYSSKQFDE